MPTEAGDTDALVPFVVEEAPVRGALIRLGATSGTILAQHAYPPPLARVLAELCAAAALLASTVKLDGSLVVQLSGDGPVRLLVVECTDTLDLRATAQWNDAQLAAQPRGASLAMLAGGPAHGRLTITLDQRTSGTLYQGVVALDGTSVAASIEHYLTTSEQLRSRLWLVAEVSQVAGLLLQRLPEARGDVAPAWARLVAGVDASFAKAVHSPHFTGALGALFPRDDVRMFDPRPVRFACRCSAGRVANALRIAGRDEVEAALAERGIVEVTCEFCNRRYTFGAADARGLFARPADARG